MRTRVALGCDHIGFELKEFIKSNLLSSGHDVLDCGIREVQITDYPIIAREVSICVTNGTHDCGIIICGTGIGVSIAANKVNGIRAALCADCYSAKMAKEHNNANVITLGARTIESDLAWKIVQAYLNSSFLGDKHTARIEMIRQMETMG
jgi:ribose 5-phosphate isomerase B